MFVLPLCAWHFGKLRFCTERNVPLVTTMLFEFSSPLRISPVLDEGGLFEVLNFKRFASSASARLCLKQVIAGALFRKATGRSHR